MPRLFDLVKCRDERLRLAFYYAMRDTVVAGDLDQAARIAYGQDRRWRRVVTLKVGGRAGGRAGCAWQAEVVPLSLTWLRAALPWSRGRLVPVAGLARPATCAPIPLLVRWAWPSAAVPRCAVPRRAACPCRVR